MHIRPATADDEPGLARLLGQLHPGEAVSFQPGRIRQAARSLVAVEQGKAAGFALATLVDYGLSSYGMIEELVVDEACRGRGIGTALLDECRAWLAREGVEVVFVSAVHEAEAFYARHGFVRCTGPWLYRGPGEA